MLPPATLAAPSAGAADALRRRMVGRTGESVGASPTTLRWRGRRAVLGQRLLPLRPDGLGILEECVLG